jgi:chorismate lyase
MTGQKVNVDCVEMRDIGPFSKASIPCSCTIPGLETGFETTRRQVFLTLSDTEERPYVYATSWWHKDVIDEYLKDKEKPIWSSLSSERTELFRDIIDVQCGYCAELERYV